MNLSPYDRDFLIRTVIGEAGNQSPEGQAAVAHSVLNRVKAGRYGGNTVQDVVLKPYQYEPWGTKPMELMGIDPKSKPYQQTAALIDQALTQPDPTGGATHFLNPEIVQKRSGKLPSWASGEGQRIGDHVFYAPEGKVQREASMDGFKFDDDASVIPSGFKFDETPAKAEPQKPSPTMGEYALDVAKAIPSGLATGAAYAAAAPQMIAELPMKGLDLALEKLGLGEKWREAGKKIEQVGSIPRPGQVAEEISQAVPKAETVPGQYAQTVSEFIPSALAGPGSLTRKVGMHGVLPAVTSETAGQATKGTDAEPYARALGALAGNVPGVMSRPRPQSGLTTEELKKQANQAYKTSKDADIVLQPQSYTGVARDIADDLLNSGFHPKLHPRATAALQHMMEFVGQPISMETADKVRRVMGAAGRTVDKDEARIVGKMINKFDDFVENLGTKDIRVTSARNMQEVKDATNALKEGRALWHRKNKSELLENAVENAKDRVGKNYTAAGFQTALRQELGSIAKDIRKGKIKGWSAQEKEQLQSIVRAASFENMLRMLGKFSPRGVVGTTLGGGAGFAALGPAGVPLVWGGAELARRASTNMTERKVNDLLEMTRTGKPLQPRAPIGQAMTPAAIQVAPYRGPSPFENSGEE